MKRYREAVEWLYAAQLRGVKLGLDNTRRLLAALDVDLEHGPRYIHVAGTNGKGSVCAMLDALCRTAINRVGLFTSPHLVSFRERIRVNGEMISEADVTEGLTRIRELIQHWPERPTFFEITTALALRYFQDARSDIVILETGMGGRLDSTNIVRPLVSVITPIAMDHQQWLGATLGEVAREKAGILKPDRPAVSAPQAPEAEAELRKAAAVRGTPLRFVSSPYEGRIGLAGEHQRWNAAVAVAAMADAGIRVRQASLERSLADVFWPGRFHRIDRFVLDGGHNPAAIQSLVATWSQFFGVARSTVVLGMLRDKDIPGIVRPLLSIANRFIVVPVRSARTAEPGDLRKLIKALKRGTEVEVCESLQPGMIRAETHPDPILITGSLFLVGEALALLDGKGQPAVTAQ